MDSSGSDSNDSSDADDATDGESYYDRQEAYARGNYPNKEKFFREEIVKGSQVYDCGNCLHMAGTIKEPVSDAQIKLMLLAAVKKKKWDTLYLFDKKGQPDLAFAGRVQDVLKDMLESGEMPKIRDGDGFKSPIRVAIADEYPRHNNGKRLNAEEFDRWHLTKWLAGDFNSQARADAERERQHDHNTRQPSSSTPAP